MALFIPDANILIQALLKQTPGHKVCREWLLARSRAGDDLGLSELVEVALLRIPTLPRLKLVSIKQAFGFWDEDLWSYERIRRINPGSRHREILKDLIFNLDLVGNDINDAWLAAIAIEHRATLVSMDTGFSRFPGLSWLNPAST